MYEIILTERYPCCWKVQHKQWPKNDRFYRTIEEAKSVMESLNKRK